MIKRILTTVFIVISAVITSACQTQEESTATLDCVEVTELNNNLIPPFIKVTVNHVPLRLSAKSSQVKALVIGQKIDVEYSEKFNITRLSIAQNCGVGEVIE